RDRGQGPARLAGPTKLDRQNPSEASGEDYFFSAFLSNSAHHSRTPDHQVRTLPVPWGGGPTPPSWPRLRPCLRLLRPCLRFPDLRDSGVLVMAPELGGLAVIAPSAAVGRSWRADSSRSKSRCIRPGFPLPAAVLPSRADTFLLGSSLRSVRPHRLLAMK